MNTVIFLCLAVISFVTGGFKIAHAADDKLDGTWVVEKFECRSGAKVADKHVYLARVTVITIDRDKYKTLINTSSCSVTYRGTLVISDNVQTIKDFHKKYGRGCKDTDGNSLENIEVDVPDEVRHFKFENKNLVLFNYSSKDGGICPKDDTIITTLRKVNDD